MQVRGGVQSRGQEGAAVQRPTRAMVQNVFENIAMERGRCPTIAEVSVELSNFGIRHESRKVSGGIDDGGHHETTEIIVSVAEGAMRIGSVSGGGKAEILRNFEERGMVEGIMQI